MIKYLMFFSFFSYFFKRLDTYWQSSIVCLYHNYQLLFDYFNHSCSIYCAHISAQRSPSTPAETMPPA